MVPAVKISWSCQFTDMSWCVKDIHEPLDSESTALATLPCRYYAPDLSRPGQYNTMVRHQYYLSASTAQQNPGRAVSSSAQCRQRARELPWQLQLGRGLQGCDAMLQVQGETWRVNAGTNKLVKID